MTPGVPRVILSVEADSRCNTLDARALGGHETGSGRAFLASRPARACGAPAGVAAGRGWRCGARRRSPASAPALSLPLAGLALPGRDAGDGAARATRSRTLVGALGGGLRSRHPGLSGMVPRALRTDHGISQERSGKTTAARPARGDRHRVPQHVAGGAGNRQATDPGGGAGVFGMVAADPSRRRSWVDRALAPARRVLRLPRRDDPHRRADEPTPAMAHAAPTGEAPAILAGLLRAAVGALMGNRIQA